MDTSEHASASDTTADPVWAVTRLVVRAFALLAVLSLIGAVGFRVLYSQAESRCLATPPGESAADYPAWDAESMRFHVATDGFTCVYDMPGGARKELHLGWLP